MPYTKTFTQHPTIELFLRRLVDEPTKVACFEGEPTQVNTFKYRLYNTLKHKKLTGVVRVHWLRGSTRVLAYLNSRWGARWKPEMEAHISTPIQDPNFSKAVDLSDEESTQRLLEALNQDGGVTGIDRIRQRIAELQDK